MTLSTGKEVRLSKSLGQKADAIAERVCALEKDMQQICMDVATDCENLEGETAYAYLKRAFPNVDSRGHRHRFMYAGLMLHECSRRRQQLPSWTVAAEAYSLPPEGQEWFFAEQRSREEVREYKRSLKAPRNFAPNQGEIVENPIRLGKAQELIAAAKQRMEKAEERWEEVKNQPEAQSNEQTHVVTKEEYEVLLEAVELAKVWQAKALQLADEVDRLKENLSTLSQNDINPVHVLASRPADSGFGSRPELDESIPPPIDYNWHKGLQVGSQEREDANQIGRLIDAIGRIQVEYAFTGIFGPHEWESILGGLERLSACADAQRRFRPGSEQGPVIDVG